MVFAVEEDLDIKCISTFKLILTHQDQLDILTKTLKLLELQATVKKRKKQQQEVTEGISGDIEVVKIHI